MTKKKLLIIGHGRHGKDTVAEMIAEMTDLKFISSSLFALDRAVWPMWGETRYDTPHMCYEDRINYRSTWKNLIKAYNTPDLCRIHKEMFAEGYDMYVGMRDRDEFEAAMKEQIFDHVIWVERPGFPKEDPSSMELNHTDADIVLENLGTTGELMERVGELCLRMGWLKKLDFAMKVSEEKPKGETKDEVVDLMEVPEGAVKLLDHGYIICKPPGGSDETIAEAARQSYGMGTSKVRDGEGLIRYLVTNYHTSPLEMGNLTFQMRLPIFVMRQLVRHRTAKLNEYSGRYSVMPRLYYVPDLDQIKVQHKTNKQGSGAPLDERKAGMIRTRMIEDAEASFDNYDWYISQGVSRETARIYLPLATYTVVTWQMDMNNMLKFLMLRDDPHAQYEIRVYAMAMAEFVEKHFPYVYKAYMRRRNMVTFTQEQLLVLLRGTGKEDLPKGEAAELEEIWQKFYSQVGDEVTQLAAPM